MIKIIGVLLIAVAAFWLGYTIGKYFEPHKDVKVDKFKSYYNLLCKWLDLEREGRTADILLTELGYRNVAVFGMGNVGKRLVDSLDGTDVTVVCGVDSFSTNEENGLKVYSKKDVLPEVDAIVVTVPFAYESVKAELEKKNHVPIVSFEHILFGV